MVSFGFKQSSKPRPAAGTSKLLDKRSTPVLGGFGGGESDEDEPTPSVKGSSAQEITTFDEGSRVIEPQSRVKLSPDVKLDGPPKPRRPLGGSMNPLAPSLSSNLKTSAIQAAAEEVDPTVFDYDSHYATTSSASAQARQRAAAKADAETRTPKYLQNMQAAASVRQRDQLRAKDKLLQKEREAEGDDYDDKDNFVTDAYKEQQEQVRRAEEEERKREEEETKAAAGKGMRTFWKGVMQEEDERHRQMTEKKPLDKQMPDVEHEKEQEEVEAEIARDMNTRGANIAINEEGQVADKRQLLSAGLNVVAKAKTSDSAATASALPMASRTAASRRNGGNDARQAMRERQSRMVEAQIEAAEKRAAEEAAEDVQKRERAAKSQKTSSEISGAKERYLQRKREAAAANAKRNPA